jgi:rubredoxin
MASVFCPSCGYNLFGIPQVRCPECGFRYDYAGIAALAKEESLRSYWAKLVITRSAFTLAFAVPALTRLMHGSLLASYLTVLTLLVGAVVLRQRLLAATPYRFWETLPLAWLCAVALAALAGQLLLLPQVGALIATAILADGWLLFLGRLSRPSYCTLSLPDQLQRRLAILTRWAEASLATTTLATLAAWFC